MLKKLFAFCFFSVFLFACKFENSSQDNSMLNFLFQNNESNEIRNVRVFVYSENNCIEYNNVTRTIMPDSYSYSDLDFYLYGKNGVTGETVTFYENGTSKDFVKIDIIPNENDDRSGAFSLDLLRTSYNLFLAAVPKGKTFDKNDTAKNTVLIGNSTADLRNNESVKFYLSAKPFDGNKAMKGSVEFALYADDWDYSNYSDGSSFKVSVGIYKMDLFNSIHENSVDSNFSLPVYRAGNLPYFDDFSKKYIFSGTPGTYNFTVCFTDKSNSSRKYFYTDILELNANRLIRRIIPIPDVVERIPELPTNFKCGFIDPVDSSSGKFLLNVEWDDNSMFEEYFELEMLNISEQKNFSYKDDYINSILGLASTYNFDPVKSWNELESHYGKAQVYSNNFFKDIGIDSEVEGSLSRNSSYVIFPVTLGGRYLMRFRAVNAAGKTDYIYPDYHSRSFKSGHANVRAFPEGSLGVSRYKIIYNISNGVFYDDSKMHADVYDDVSDDVAFANVSYSSFSKNGTPLIVPKNISYADGKKASLGQLVSENIYGNERKTFYSWLNWRESSVNGNDLAENYIYNNYENLYLFANFNCTQSALGLLSIFNSENPYIKDTSIIVIRGIWNASSKKYDLILSRDNFISADDDSIDVSLDDCIFVLVKNNSEFEDTKLEVGKQGTSFKDFGDSMSTGEFHWLNEGISENYSYDYWAIDISEFSEGLHFANVKAYKKIVNDPAVYTLTINVSQ